MFSHSIYTIKLVERFKFQKGIPSPRYFCGGEKTVCVYSLTRIVCSCVQCAEAKFSYNIVLPHIFLPITFKRQKKNFFMPVPFEEKFSPSLKWLSSWVLFVLRIYGRLARNVLSLFRIRLLRKLFSSTVASPISPFEGTFVNVPNLGNFLSCTSISYSVEGKNGESKLLLNRCSDLKLVLEIYEGHFERMCANTFTIS